MKLCIKCNLLKSIDLFQKKSNSYDGLQCWCRSCMREYKINWSKNNPEKIKMYSKKAYKNNAAKIKIGKAKWYRKHIKEQKARVLKWQKNHPGKVNAANVAYQAAKLKRTPVWADKKSIQEFYILASKNNMHVDHIIPLRGKLVSGLHILENLQLLPSTDNHQKSNHYTLK